MLHGVTLRSVVSGFVLALVLCAMNSYLTLSFGVIEEGPTIAALFFFAVFLLSKSKITTDEMVIVATMGSAGGSLGFIANFYAAKAMLGTPYTVTQMAAFGISSSLVGLVMVIPLRQILVLKEALPWPGSRATESVIRTLVEHGDPKQAQVLVVTLAAAMAYVIVNSDGPFGWVPAATALGGLAAYGGSIAWAPFAIGGSYLMGMRTCVGFLVGAVLLMVMAPHVPLEDMSSPNRYYWPGLGFLVASGMTVLVLHWRLLADSLRSILALGAKTDDDDPVMTGRTFTIFAVVAFVAAAGVLTMMFGVPFLLVVALVVVGGLLQNLIATRAAAQTAFNPARVMGILLQGVTAMLGGRAADINLTGAGFVAGSGAQAGNLTGDMVYGRWLKVPAAKQFWTQALTVVPCAIVAAYAFDLILKARPTVLETGSPIGKMWAASARVFEGQQPLPEGAGLALAIGAAVGIVYVLLERIDAVKKWIPESIGIGLGMVLSPSLGLAFFVGGFLSWIVGARWLKLREVTLTTIAVACIVAEGIGGVVQAVIMAVMG